MIISFIGPPGSGKSTQIDFVSNELLKNKEVIILRVPNLVKKNAEILPYLNDKEVEQIDSLAQSSYENRDKGKLSPILLDEILFNVAERAINDNKHVVLDGAPRGLEQARLFSKSSSLIQSTKIINLAFISKEFEHSISRQFYRESLNRGLDVAISRLQKFRNKYETYSTDTINGLNYLINLNIPCITIDASMNQRVVSSYIREFLNENEHVGYTRYY